MLSDNWGLKKHIYKIHIQTTCGSFLLEEALQQVQLKAFIAETRANAEAERAQNLERRLEKVIGQGGVGAYLDEGRNDERLPVGMGTGA